jgi:hypothetical protein
MYFDGVTGLSLSYGQVVIITKKIDDHWFCGRLPGDEAGGVFPSSFVEILEYTNKDFMHMQGDSVPIPSISKDEDTQRTRQTSWWTTERNLVKTPSGNPAMTSSGRKLRIPPPEFHEEHFLARELQRMVLTPRPSLALPPFKYPEIKKPQFKFPLPQDSFILLSVACKSATPGKPVKVGVSLSSHAHDSIFVSSIHLTIKPRGSVVLEVRPIDGTKSGGHEMDIQSTSSTETKLQFSGKLGVPQMVTAEGVVARELSTINSTQTDGKETILAQISGDVIGKSAFWDLQSEITPSRLRGFSGHLWDGMLFVLDRYSTKLDYSLTVNCRIQGEAKDRIIKVRWWKAWQYYRG